MVRVKVVFPFSNFAAIFLVSAQDVLVLFLIGPIVRVEGIVDAAKYRGILENHMLPHTREKMAARWIFKQDNGPKHTSCLMKGWLKNNKIEVLQSPSLRPDLNLI